MIVSMTGFGRSRLSDRGTTVEIQISSVNHRSVQVAVRGDNRDLAIDEDLRRRCRERLVRGSITVQIALSAQTIPLDRARLAAAWRELAALAAELGAPPPTLDRVAALLPIARDESIVAVDLIQRACDLAIDDLLAARHREGAALAVAFRTCADGLRGLLPRLQQAAAERLPRARAGLHQRMVDAWAGSGLPALDPALLAREIALIAERIDVTEELTRLASHLAALDATLNAGGEIGRKLDFLAQELGRELSTTAAKANDATLAALTVEGRLLVDQLKEQAANAV
jgi:uncharacterized protein YicC (UPF0701 family)